MPHPLHLLCIVPALFIIFRRLVSGEPDQAVPIPIDIIIVEDAVTKPACLIKMTWNWNTIDSCFLSET
ncbi:copper transporter complex subunit Ctr4 [Podospora pseudocomata]|uniref:Copper transporter complex subunit Ctr4 n=1 Tax=Podospora pseudocomata TaxID=2093779 RepID=A0ABR0GLY3_9PEZI|nr:copper transporter complex subunit Ctr4 [Podospora pseudocomata]